MIERLAGALLCSWLPLLCLAQLTTQPFATGLNNPVDIANAGDGSDRLFIVEQAGLIQVYAADGTDLGTFLDITSLTGGASGERGLLGLAFHPNYSSNGYFYVYYTNPSGGLHSVLARYSVSGDPNRASSGSGQILMTIDQPYGNHNGGDLNFHPLDNTLYIASGDGGDGHDPDEVSQDLTSPLGKILRIDVSSPNSAPYYQIPPNNPYATAGNDTVPEIWAYGVRNPWRFCFDNNGDLWIADVGQATYEEVNYVSHSDNVPGINYGWDCFEGTAACGSCGNPNCSGVTDVDPLHQYDLSGQSITGGFVMRGSSYPNFNGQYLFADYRHSLMWVLDKDAASRAVSVTLVPNSPAKISSFGQDEQGRIYAASYASSATVHRLIDAGALPIELLSVRVDRNLERNVLSWETSLELNASHFEIERRVGHQAFQQIGIVPATGEASSSEVTAYQFEDPVRTSGQYYYRLKAMDLDGSFTYSMILNISVSSSDDLQLTPNPARDQVQVLLPPTATGGSLQVTSLSGALLLQRDVPTDEVGQPLTFDTSDLDRGVVLVTFTDAQLQLTKKLILYR